MVFQREARQKFRLKEKNVSRHTRLTFLFLGPPDSGPILYLFFPPLLDSVSSLTLPTTNYLSMILVFNNRNNSLFP